MTVEQFSKSLDINPDKVKTSLLNIFRNFKLSNNEKIFYINTIIENNNISISYSKVENPFSFHYLEVSIEELFKEYRKEKLKSMLDDE